MELNLDWYRPSPAITEFHESLARIRALIGGRGSGKTTAIAIETISHSFHNAGAKIYILRKTQLSNEDTTQETFEGPNGVFANMGTGYIDTSISLFKKIDGGKCFRLPSRKAIELYNLWQQQNPKSSKVEKIQWLETIGSRYCSFLHFAGVPEERYRASRFRGYECSLLIFVEADQLAREDLDLGVACLRWKGSDPETCDELGFIRDSGVILDTNPPSPTHWIAKLEFESVNDPGIRYWHLRTKDNAHNLPPNYVQDLERQYKNNPAMFRRMLLGQYDDAWEGKGVLFEFNELHVAENLPWPKGAYLIRGWDFGTTQATIWSAYWTQDYSFEDAQGSHTIVTEYWWDLYEYFAQQSDAERQCKNVLDITQQIFPFWNDREVCSGVRDFCDIAGNQVKDTGSSVKVLHSHNIFPGWQAMGLQESIAVYNRLLSKKNPFEQPVYQIDGDCCPMLYKASRGGYRYPTEGEPGFGGNEPLKGLRGGNFDHVADAARYAKYNCLRLIRTEVERLNKPVGVLAGKTAENRPRRYW